MGRPWRLLGVIGPARKDVVVWHAPAPLKPGHDALARRFEQLELNWSAGLSLHYDRPCADAARGDEVADANVDDIAPSELAIDGEVEQRPIPESSLAVKLEPDGPYLLRLKRPLGARYSPSILGRPLAPRRVIFRVSHGFLPLAGLANESMRHEPNDRLLAELGPVALRLLGEKGDIL